jgi:hypothetical protein
MGYRRVPVTGCGGMLGNAIYAYFRRLATDRQIEPDERDWLHSANATRQSRI